MSNIYEFTPLYSLLKRYITFTFKQFYSEFIIVGKENIPKTGPVIYAPNHTNALMDALAVLASIPHNQSIVFLARSDIFKKNFLSKILRFTKIMPAYRMRDGIENLSKNDHTFERCIEILDKNHALGIMPEGDQGEQKRIRPLRKGIFRIGFTAQQTYGKNQGVKIIPVGIVLEDLIKFGQPIIINFGKPIEISDYMPMYDENPVLAMNEIKNRLKSDLNNLTLNLDTHTYYDCFEIAVKIAENTILEQSGLDNSTISLFIARHKIVEKLKEIEQNNPDKMAKINSLCNNYQTKMCELKLKSSDFGQNSLSFWTLMNEQIYLFSTSGFFAIGFLFNALPFFTPHFISKKILKVEFNGFLSSIHYAIGILIFPLFYTLQTTLISTIFNPSFLILAAIFLSQYILGKFAFSWHKKAKNHISKQRYLKLKREKPEQIKQIEDLKYAIQDMLTQ